MSEPPPLQAKAASAPKYIDSKVLEGFIAGEKGTPLELTANLGLIRQLDKQADSLLTQARGSINTINKKRKAVAEPLKKTATKKKKIDREKAETELSHLVHSEQGEVRECRETAVQYCREKVHLAERSLELVESAMRKLGQIAKKLETKLRRNEMQVCTSREC
jgi:F0F1-type ATP synthase membrane subunit b/b'